MRQFGILLRKDLLELWRTKKVLIISIVFILFALSSPLLAKMTPELLKTLGDSIQITVPEATIMDSYGQFVKNISQICLYVMIIVFGGLIVGERKSGMYNNLLNNWVKKSTFVLSKVSAQVLIVAAVYAVSCLLFSIYNYVLFGNFFVEHSLLSFVATFVFLLFVISFINFFSVISRNNIVSIILGFATTIVIAIFDVFTFGKYLPNYLINLSVTVFNDPAAMSYIWKNMAITLVLSVVVVFASIRLCKSKE